MSPISDLIPGPLDLRLLRALVEVHRTGSMTAAAQRMGISQPAISAQIRELERQLGRSLFVRQARGAVPTALADMLASEAAPHIDALVRLAVAGADRSSLLERTINVGGPAEFVTALALPSLAPLVARGLRVRTTLGLPDDLLAALVSRRLDIVLSTVRVRRRGLDAIALWDEELQLIAGAAIAPPILDRLRGNPDPMSALAGLPIVAYAEDMPLVRRFFASVFDGRPPGRPAVVVPDLRGVIAAVAAGIGISVVPGYLCRGALDDGTVVALMAPEVPPINTIHLAVRTGDLGYPHIAAVHAALIAQARSW